MMIRPAIDTGSACLAGVDYLWVDHLAAGDELRFAILDDEHVIGVGVHLGTALHTAVGDDGQTFILDDARALHEGSRNLVVVDVADSRWKTKTGSRVEVHRVVADRAGFRGVFPLVRGLGGDRDHVAPGQMMTHPALDTGSARLAALDYLWVDHLAPGDELRFAILDDEHVVGIGVHLGAALHAAVGDDGQTLILDDARALNKGGRNLVVVDVADSRWKTKTGGGVEVHRVIGDRAGFRGVFPLVRGLGGDRDHVALAQMMTHAALDTGSARLAGAHYLWVGQLAPGDKFRFAILDNEHVVGIVVHLRAALHDALGDDDQTLILEHALALDEAGRNLVVVYGVDARRKPGGHPHGYQGRGREYRGECERVFHGLSPCELT